MLNCHSFIILEIYSFILEIHMNSSKKIRVAVLYGGRSPEHEVSLQSAKNIIQYLDPSLFEVIPIGIDKQGTWFLGDISQDKQLTDTQELKLLRDDHRQLFTPDWIGKSVVPRQASELITRATKNQRLFDVVFPAMHGALCEDGAIQGLFELADVPYVGCGILSSAIGMDKDVAKRLAIQANIDVHPYKVIKHNQWQTQAAELCQQIQKQLGFPVFVKPANTGSSIGITKVKTPDQLPCAIEAALQLDNKILVEKAIDAMELEIAVLETPSLEAEPIMSIVGEVKPRHEFYSYAAKYLDEHGAKLIIPAPITAELGAQAQAIAKKLFTILECEGMARVDLFLEKSSQRIYFNEINTIPGFTQISMYPKLMSASGISYSELLTRLVKLAMDKHCRRSALNRSYCHDIE